MELPEAFILRMKDFLSDDWEAFSSALDEESPTSIRLNPEKRKYGVEYETSWEEVPWASWAYYLNHRPSFTLDPLFHAGCYYVQEAASMFLESVVRKFITTPVRMLDLCAAPGGKSTHLLSVLPEGSLLLANEVIRQRTQVLSENLIKWGNPNVIISQNDPAVIGKIRHFFDVMLADLPCSGEGLFRKDPAAKNEWSMNHVRLCAERQRRIIANAWTALKPGGILIYSTCTYNREENEENLAWICRELGAETLGEAQRFMPHRTKGEGFFIAALGKMVEDRSGGSIPSFSDRKKNRAGRSFPSSNESHLKKLLSSPDFTIVTDNNLLNAYPSEHTDTYRFLKDRLKIVYAGLSLGEMKGSDFVPSQALAFSGVLSDNVFPVWELNRDQALKYLRKETFQDFPSGLPKGYILVCYRNCPLGFVKNIGNRMNNLYPQDWRIRMNIPQL